MNRSQRMEVVKSVAEHEEQQECREMGESGKVLQAKLGRLEELSAYRQAYAARLTRQQGLSALQWQDYHKFLHRLDRALESQQQVVLEGRSQQEIHRKRWMQKRQRLESLSRIVDRYKALEFEEKERQLNKIQDSQPQGKSPYDNDQ